MKLHTITKEELKKLMKKVNVNEILSESKEDELLCVLFKEKSMCFEMRKGTKTITKPVDGFTELEWDNVMSSILYSTAWLLEEKDVFKTPQHDYGFLKDDEHVRLFVTHLITRYPNEAMKLLKPNKDLADKIKVENVTWTMKNEPDWIY